MWRTTLDSECVFRLKVLPLDHIFIAHCSFFHIGFSDEQQQMQRKHYL